MPHVNNLQLAKFMARPLTTLMKVFSPISNLLVRWTKAIEKRLQSRSISGGVTSREDIDTAIALTVSQGGDTEKEVDILKSIVKFGDVSVKQIMRSRVDVAAVDIKSDYKELLKLIRESGFSRIPVYNENFDTVTGILYVKDLIGHLTEKEDFEWQQLIRTDVLFVPEAKKIDDLLREFQLQHMHMAIVVDEYGGTSGIVTLEDIMEEVIGEIKDEFDDEPELIYRKVGKNTYVFDGKTMLNDVCRVLGIDTNTFDLVKGESESLAGLVLEMVEEIPEVGTELTLNEFKFKIVSSNERRIEEIQVSQANNKLASTPT